MGEIIARRCWWIVAAIAALGFALRLWAAQGGLWLDEAWSALMAHEAGTPLGVFLNINHDNNHHLNSLWLQLVGIDAPPALQRTLSIVTGSVTILIAARIGHRRSAWAAITAALLFAASPILVTYGSEARGYAPMLLALLAAADRIDTWLDRPETRSPAIPLALLALIGLLSQLTMAFGLAVLGLWSLWCLHRTQQPLWPTSARLWGPATIASAVALLVIFVPAWRAGGMAFGAADPFTLASWIAGIWQALDYGIGDAAALAGVLLILLLATGGASDRLASFGIIAMLAPALAVLAGHLPNAGAGRLYLVSATGALFLLTALIDAAYRDGQRRLAAIALLLATTACTIIAIRITMDHRADPAQAIAAMASRAPAGADIAAERPRSDAILVAAAASASYPLRIAKACPAPLFLFVERDGSERFAPSPVHCSAPYREIAGDTVQGLSGSQWKLYERSIR